MPAIHVVRRRIVVSARKFPSNQADGGVDVLKLSQHSLLRKPNLGIDGEEQALQQFLGVSALAPESNPA